MEIMDALAIEAAEASVRPGYPDAPALLIVEIEGEREVVTADARSLEALIARSGALSVQATEDWRAGADLERAQERVLGGRLARARLHHPGRRRPAHAARRGASRDRAAQPRARQSASRTSSTRATGTCTR